MSPESVACLCVQPVTVYTDNKLPFPIRVQLMDSSGTPSTTADIRVHITKDPKIKVSHQAPAQTTQTRQCIIS